MSGIIEKRIQFTSTFGIPKEKGVQPLKYFSWREDGICSLQVIHVF